MIMTYNVFLTNKKGRIRCAPLCASKTLRILLVHGKQTLFASHIHSIFGSIGFQSAITIKESTMQLCPNMECAIIMMSHDSLYGYVWCQQLPIYTPYLVMPKYMSIGFPSAKYGDKPTHHYDITSDNMPKYGVKPTHRYINQHMPKYACHSVLLVIRVIIITSKTLPPSHTPPFHNIVEWSNK